MYDIWGIDNPSSLTATDDQAIGSTALNNDITYLQSQINYLGYDRYFNSAGDSIMVSMSNSNYTGPGIPSPIVTGSTLSLTLNCGGYSNCAEIRSTNTGAINIIAARKISFNNSNNYAAPSTSATLNLPSAPKNEYASHTVTFTHTFNSIGLGAVVMSGVTNLPRGDQYYPPSAGTPTTTITCTRAATPLTLTLGASSIDFGTVMMGSSPVTRPLTWTATGSGQTGTWTLTFVPQYTGTSGKYINLGGADISVLDSGNNLVPLNTQVNISGTSGSYKLSLDPTKGTPGAKTTNLNVTLTAN